MLSTTERKRLKRSLRKQGQLRHLHDEAESIAQLRKAENQRRARRKQQRASRRANR